MANSLKHECTGFVCLFSSVEYRIIIFYFKKVINIDKSLLLQKLDQLLGQEDSSSSESHTTQQGLSI